MRLLTLSSICRQTSRVFLSCNVEQKLIIHVVSSILYGVQKIMDIKAFGALQHSAGILLICVQKLVKFQNQHKINNKKLLETFYLIV
jgi:hypothetical protein